MTSKRAIGGEMELSVDSFRDLQGGPTLPTLGLPVQRTCDTGRSALRLALRDHRQRGGLARIWLPDYICPSVPAACHAEHYQIAYFPDRPGQLVFDQPPAIEAGEIVLFVHYFGLRNRAAEAWLKLQPAQRPWHVIADCVQAAFSAPVADEADYAITSLRKWVAVPDGAVLSAQCFERCNDLPAADETFVSQRVVAKLLRHQRVPAGEFLPLIEQSEALLETSSPTAMSWIAQKIWQSVDQQNLRAARRANWHELQHLLAAEPLISRGLGPLFSELAPDEVPLAYPLRIPRQRDKMRAGLADRGIFCPVHWHLDASPACSATSLQLSAEILSLPIDQRYDRADMRRIVDALQELSA